MKKSEPRSADDLDCYEVPAGLSMLSITEEHAAKVVELPPLHKDPFDRVLIAQALIEPMILVTTDEGMNAQSESKGGRGHGMQRRNGRRATRDRKLAKRDH